MVRYLHRTRRARSALARIQSLGLAAAIAVALCPAVRSADSSQAPLTLAEARRLALERNADFRVSQAQVDAALAQLRVVREFPNPALGLSTSKISTDGTPEGTVLGNSLLNRSYDSIASLSQLFLVGKRGLMRDAATAGVHSAEFQREDARRLLLQAVTQAYAAALAAQREADVLTDSAAKLRREADIAAHRFQVGDLSASDKGQLEIAADQDELNADSERATAKAAVVTLEILLGEPAPAGNTALADTLDGWMQSIPPDLGDAPVGARPDIAAAESAVSQADTNVRLQQRQRIPDVTASVQYERNPPFQTNTVGVGVSLPLPLWDHFDGEILSAKAAREQSQAQLDKTRIQAAADVAAARVAFREASQRSRRYQTSLVPKSAEVVGSVTYAFGKGGAALVDLLEAERNDNAIRVAAVQAQADTASAAAVLQAALGRTGGSDAR
jgi:cobalt-zinc-cadmium efflux system outer membrane protein